MDFWEEAVEKILQQDYSTQLEFWPGHTLERQALAMNQALLSIPVSVEKRRLEAVSVRIGRKALIRLCKDYSLSVVEVFTHLLRKSGLNIAEEQQTHAWIDAGKDEIVVTQFREEGNGALLLTPTEMTHLVRYLELLE